MGGLAANDKFTTVGGCLPLPRGYIHAYDHFLKQNSSLKPLGQSKPNLIWSVLGEGGGGGVKYII